MSIHCDIILPWGATPEQLKALGAALWNWYGRTAAGTGMYQHLDNQALADLIAGKFPVSSQPEQRGVLFGVRDEGSSDRRVTIDSLRRVMPAHGVAQIVVDGIR